MRKLIYIVTIICLSIPGLLLAQQTEMDNRQQFALAESEYQVGHIDSAIDMLNQHINTYSGTLKVSAYRLLALCSLAQDDLTNANKYVDLLLKEDPYYSISINDPERFAELIRNKKEGKTTLVTASQQAETLEEAPVPVTLITEEMIQAIGARNLKELLTTYVPGMTSVESASEYNVSMRGIYTASQQKILIMLNGVRLNSYTTNIATPDYGISLSKIKQIEILRGPSSSLYGNVALTAVVNIITKDGGDINGLQASYGMGSYGQYKADLLLGKRYMDTDILAWGSFYKSDGEKISISKENGWGPYPHDGSIIINGFNGKPSYDIGTTIKLKKINLLFNRHYSKMIEPYVFAGDVTNYDYDKYRKISGVKPGNGRTSTNAEISYQDHWQNLSFYLAAYLNIDNNMNYEVCGDVVDSTHPGYYNMFFKDSILVPQGMFTALNWDELTGGGQARISYTYSLSKGHGNIMAGLQYEVTSVYDTYTLYGDKFESIPCFYDKSEATITTGKEQSISSYLQLKHYFNSKFILNAGLRYDRKSRINNYKINALSPRVALIYLPNNKLSFKASYSKAFVDAPYFYRNNTSPSYKGSENLQSEYMHAIQLSATVHPTNRLTYDCNFYYNYLSNLIYYQVVPIPYINAGYLKTCGWENMLTYTSKRLITNLNFTYQHMLNHSNYTARDHTIDNIPSFSSNLVMRGLVLSKKQHNLWLNGSVCFYSKQNSPIQYLYQGFNNRVEDLKATTPARAIITAGLNYNHNQKLLINFTCYNLLNTHYNQNGSTFYPVPQESRSILGTITYTFNSK